MILCHNCLHKEMVGALFCSECGAQLIYDEGVPTSTIQKEAFSTEEDALIGLEIPETLRPSSSPRAKQSKVVLNMISTGDLLSLGGREEITLGRINEGQPVVPDIDLSPYKAYEAGVSRMHASMKIKGEEISIFDLGSANGTRINGRRISPNIPHPLKHGDIITLGKLKIQVLLYPKGNDGG